MPKLQRLVGQECRTPKCQRHGQRLSPHEGFCEACGEPLAPVLGWDPHRIALAVGIPAIAMLLLCGAVYYLAHRPRPLTDEMKRRLTGWVREADRDRVVTSGKQAELDGFIESARLDPEATVRFVAKARRQLEESRLYLSRGHRLVAESRYDEARQALQSAVKDDPENAMAWANLGVADAISGREQEALGAYSAALRLDRRNWLAHYNLGLFWARRGQPELALSHLTEAFAAVPDPASGERRSMSVDLHAAAVPAALREDPRFQALLAGSKAVSR